MKHLHLWLLVPLLSACAPEYTVVDDACTDKVGGSKKVLNPDDVDAVLRINCYRKAARSSKARFEPPLQRAVEAHAKYLTLNLSSSMEFPFDFETEDLSKPGFTGTTSEERYAEAGFIPPVPAGSVTYFFWDSYDEAERIDFWMANPWARHDFLSPSWMGSGFASGTPVAKSEDGGQPDPDRGFLYANWFYARDDGTAARPVVWPFDGQEEVDPSFLVAESPIPSKVDFCREYGTPISVSVGAGETDYRFTSVNFEDDAGETVPFQVVTAPESSALTPNVIVVLPLEPLAPNASFHFSAELTTAQGDRRVSSTFITAASASRPGLDDTRAFCAAYLASL